MSLRLMIVGHSYVTAFAQRKYAALKQIDPTVMLRLVVPESSAHVFRNFQIERARGLAPDDLVVLPQYFARSHMTYCHPPRRLLREIRCFQPDVVHIEEDPYSAAGLESLLAVKLACPSAKVSFFTWDNLNRRPAFPLGSVKRTLTKFGFQRAQLVVCGNRRAQIILREQKGYLGRSVVLPQVGLDEAEYTGESMRAWRDELGIPKGVVAIGYVGRLLEEKGIGDLLAALAMLMDLDWRFVVVGSGAFESEVRSAAVGPLAGRVIQRGPVLHDEVPGLLKALDLFVLPSRSTPVWIEQFGLTLAQAMMAGVACIGSNSGAIPEVMGPTGIVVPEADPGALAVALRRLLLDPRAREDIAAGGLARARSHYTNKVVATAYLGAFRELVA